MKSTIVLVAHSIVIVIRLRSYSRCVISLWHLNLSKSHKATEPTHMRFSFEKVIPFDQFHWFWIMFLFRRLAAVGFNCRPIFVNGPRQMLVLWGDWVRYRRWSIWSRVGVMHRSHKISTAHQIQFGAIIWIKAIQFVWIKIMRWTNWLAHWPMT